MEFNEIFLNDYITFNLVNLYNNIIHNFTINNKPHKLILLILDLKFRTVRNEMKDKEEDDIKEKRSALKNSISKILW